MKSILRIRSLSAVLLIVICCGIANADRGAFTSAGPSISLLAVPKSSIVRVVITNHSGKWFKLYWDRWNQAHLAAKFIFQVKDNASNSVELRKSARRVYEQHSSFRNGSRASEWTYVPIAPHGKQVISINLESLYDLVPGHRYYVSVKFKPDFFKPAESQNSNQVTVRLSKASVSPMLSMKVLDPSGYKYAITEQP